MLQVPLLQGRHSQHLASQWHSWVVQTDQRFQVHSAVSTTGATRSSGRATTGASKTATAVPPLESSSPEVRSLESGSARLSIGTLTSRTRALETWSLAWTTASGQAAGRPWSAFPHGLVHVVWQDVKLPLGIQVDAVITGTGPVPIAVDQGHVKGQEPEQAVHVEDGFQGCLEFLRRCLVERAAQRDQGLPGFGAILRLDLESFTISCNVFTQVPESAVGLWVSTDLPAGTLGGPIVLGNELLVELFDVGVETPTTPLDHNLDEVGLGDGQM